MRSPKQTLLLSLSLSVEYKYSVSNIVSPIHISPVQSIGKVESISVGVDTIEASRVPPPSDPGRIFVLKIKESDG